MNKPVFTVTVSYRHSADNLRRILRRFYLIRGFAFGPKEQTQRGRVLFEKIVLSFLNIVVYCVTVIDNYFI